MVAITVEATRLYMLTEYGAYGRLLLHFTSGKFHNTSPSNANSLKQVIIMLNLEPEPSQSS